MSMTFNIPNSLIILVD